MSSTHEGKVEKCPACGEEVVFSNSVCPNCRTTKSSGPLASPDAVPGSPVSEGIAKLPSPLVAFIGNPQICLATAALLMPAGAIVYVSMLDRSDLGKVMSIVLMWMIIGLLLSSIAWIIPGPKSTQARSVMQLCCGAMGVLSPVWAFIVIKLSIKAGEKHHQDMSIVVVYMFLLAAGILAGLIYATIATVLGRRYRAVGIVAFLLNCLIALIMASACPARG